MASDKLPDPIDHLAVVNVCQVKVGNGKQPSNSKVDVIRKLLRKVPKSSLQQQQQQQQQQQSMRSVPVSALKTMEHTEPYQLVEQMNKKRDFFTTKQTFRCHMCALVVTGAYPLIYPTKMTVSNGVTKWTGRGLMGHWNCLYRYGEVTTNVFDNIGTGLCTLMAEEVYQIKDIEKVKARPGEPNEYAPQFLSTNVFEALSAVVTVQIPALEASDPGLSERILDTSRVIVS